VLKHRLLSLLVAAVAATIASASPAQQSYPDKPVRVVVGFPAGTATDILSRLYVAKLNEEFGGRFVVENMPGAATNNAAAMVARAEPDGHTLFVASNAQSISVSLFQRLRYEFPGDFAPIALLVSSPTLLVVGPGLKVNNVLELVAAAKAKPGELTYGSAGVGTGPQLAAELLAMHTATKFTHVPYKGTNEAVGDLLTGRISMLFAAAPVVAGFIADGRLKALAVTSAKRTSIAPDLMTVAESGVPGFDVTLWFGLVAPKGTSPHIVNLLASRIEAIQKGPDIKQQLAKIGGEPLIGSGAEFAAFIVNDIPKWKKAVDHSGMKVE
jgi:tripartite-type tricarboxylate transporter receptor subunit TctC